MASLQEYLDAQRKMFRNKKNFVLENKRRVRQDSIKISNEKKKLSEPKLTFEKRAASLCSSKEHILRNRQYGVTSSMREVPSNEISKQKVSAEVNNANNKVIILKEQGVQTDECVINTTKTLKELSLNDNETRQDCGDQSSIKKLENNSQTSHDQLKKNETNYVKLNMMTHYKERFPRSEKPDPTKAPPNYQKGVLPKYLREKKESKDLESNASNEEAEEEVCAPPGHILIPEEDKQEHLKFIRQRYADLVTELNNLPMSSDTLKVKQRKFSIDKELERMENAIKLFSRDKLYVKVT